MRIKTFFGTLLCSAYSASASREPLERFYAGMFASYFDWLDSQPGCAVVKRIAQGERLPPYKLLRFYRDERNPRCPKKMKEDLAAVMYSCFSEASQCAGLRAALEAFLDWIPQEDAEDLRLAAGSGDLAQLWTYLTWYALCGDYCE